MDQKLKDDLDARRFRTAVAKGLDLAQVLQVVFGGRDEALSGKRWERLRPLGAWSGRFASVGYPSRRRARSTSL
jgi:hypothetical protein